MVVAIISAMVKDKRFKDAIKAKIGTAVDTSEMEERIEALCTQLKQVQGTKTRLEHQMDNLPMPVQGQEIKNLPLESESTVEPCSARGFHHHIVFSGICDASSSTRIRYRNNENYAPMSIYDIIPKCSTSFRA